MTQALSDSQTHLKQWAQRAVETGWLREQSAAQLDRTNAATPSALFDTVDRPLVISLFGGTGVGKSTLLNRLAGKTIATSSAVRPTSKAITAYRHESITLSALPDGFPVESLNTATHTEEQFKSILWVDMPDFDSVEVQHQRMVDLWLPYIDVVLYVVSPDRYRDDRGWRLLLEHSSQHAWAFVINHWDRGDARQLSDFTAQLQAAGLENPVIFCTDSSGTENQSGEQSPNEDDFDKLKDHIANMANAALVARLEKRGVLQRARLITDTTQQWRNELGSDDVADSLQQHWEQHFGKEKKSIIDTHRWKIAPIAKQFEPQNDSALSALFKRKSPIPALINSELGTTNNNDLDPATTHNQETPKLVDQTLLDDIQISAEQFIQQTHSNRLPIHPLRKHVQLSLDDNQSRYEVIVRTAVQESLERPGTAIQRILHKVMGWACTLLPLATMGWVGYRLVSVFQTSGGNPGAYLGGNFAVHSALLIGLAWLVPFVLHRQLKPSAVKAAARGLLNGLNKSLDSLEETVSSGLTNVQAERRLVISELDDITSSLHQSFSDDLPESVQRMVFPNLN